MIILVNTAGVNLWKEDVEQVELAKVEVEDIYYVKEIDLKEKKFMKPFFSEYNLVFVEADIGKFTKDSFSEPDVRYIVVTSKIDICKKLLQNFKIDKYYNTYAQSKNRVASYMRARTNISVRELTRTLNKLGRKYNKLDNVIKLINSGSKVPDMNTLTVESAIIHILRGRMTKQYATLVYQYRYSPQFLLGLLANKIDKFLELREEYLKGNFNGINVTDNCKKYKLSELKAKTIVSVFAEITTEQLMKLRHEVKQPTKGFAGYTLLMSLPFLDTKRPQIFRYKTNKKNNKTPAISPTSAPLPPEPIFKVNVLEIKMEGVD